VIKDEADIVLNTQALRIGQAVYADDRGAEIEWGGWSRSSRKSHWPQQQNWSGSFRKIHEFPCSSSSSCGHSMRGRFSEGGSGSRGRGHASQQKEPSRRYSGSEARPAGLSRTPRSGSFDARDDYYSAENFGGSHSRFREDRKHVAEPRSDEYDYSRSDRNLDRGYGGPPYAPPLCRCLMRTTTMLNHPPSSRTRSRLSWLPSSRCVTLSTSWDREEVAKQVLNRVKGTAKR
jgi:hypothetical protein